MIDKRIKSLVIALLSVIILLQWASLFYYSFTKYLVTDYYFFHYSFDNVWHDKPNEWLYDCERLQSGAREIYAVDYPPNACYLYPPHFAVFFSWLAAFSYENAEIIWKIGMNVLYMLGVYLFLTILFKEQERKRFIFWFLFLLSLLHTPFMFDFQASNSNRLTFILLALLFYFHYGKKRDFISGIFLGLAIVFKITPAIIFVLYLCQKKFKIVLGTLFSIAVSTLLVLTSISWHTLWKFSTEDFWDFTDKLQILGVPFDNSIKGMLSSYVPSAPVSVVFYLYVLFFFLFYLYLLYKNNSQNFEIALIALSPLVFSPHLEVHHMIVAVFVQIILVHSVVTCSYKKAKKIVLYVLLGAMYYIFTFIDFWMSKGEYFIALVLLIVSVLLMDRKGKLPNFKNDSKGA